MNIIDKYFEENNKNLTFIELKKRNYIKLNEVSLSGVPLPIITDELIKEISSGNLENEVNMIHIIDGIIYLMGIDKDFKYMDKYLIILESYKENMIDYIYGKALQKIYNKELDFGGIFLRTLLNLEPNNVNARFNYALVLEEIGRLNNEKDIDGNDEFINASTDELETILDIDDKYSLAYYKLGFHYKYYEQFIKAKLTWNKFLMFDEDEDRHQEIREEIEMIESSVNFETGLTYITYNQYDKALIAFEKLLPKHENDWNVLYLIGMCYKGLGDLNTAIDYLNTALELNDEEPDLYNEIGIVLFTDGKIIDAINTFNKGIEKSFNDYKLFFNRGLGYIQLGEYMLALEDINRANTLNPEDENVIKHKIELEDLISKP